MPAAVKVPGQLELFSADHLVVTRRIPQDPIDLPETETWWEVAVPDLAPAGSVLRVQQLHALVARTQSLRAEALAALQGCDADGGAGPGEDRPAAGVADDAVVDELAPLLALGQTALRRRLQEADQLRRCLPRTAALFSEGLVDHPQVAVVVRETALLTEAQAAEVDAGVVGDLIGATPGAVAELVRTEVARVDAEAVRRRSQARTRERRVVFTPLADGMASLTATGPAPQVRSWWDLLDAGCRDRTRPAAQHDPYAAALADEERRAGDRGAVGEGASSAAAGAEIDGRGPDARRFDALGELVEHGFAAAPALGLGAGPQLVVALSALLGVDEEPASLSGCGPVPAWLARAAARARRSRVALVDEHDGRLLGVDPRTLPPGAFDALLTAPRTVPPATADGRGAAPSASGVHLHDDLGVGAGACVRGSGAGGAGGAGLGVDGAGVVDAGSSSGGADLGPGGSRAPCAGDGRTRSECAVAATGGGAYAIPAAVRRVVALRAPRCCAPGCRVPAIRCDLDHVVPWPTGPTCPCNLAPLCRTHHRMKHERGWTLSWASEDPDDPTLVWRSPEGREHLVEPLPLLHRTSGVVRPALRALLVALAGGGGPSDVGGALDGAPGGLGTTSTTSTTGATGTTGASSVAAWPRPAARLAEGPWSESDDPPF